VSQRATRAVDGAALQASCECKGIPACVWDCTTKLTAGLSAGLSALGWYSNYRAGSSNYLADSSNYQTREADNSTISLVVLPGW